MKLLTLDITAIVSNNCMQHALIEKNEWRHLQKCHLLLIFQDLIHIKEHFKIVLVHKELQMTAHIIFYGSILIAIFTLIWLHLKVFVAQLEFKEVTILELQHPFRFHSFQLINN